MLGFEPRISGDGSDRSANCATATTHSRITKYFPSIQILYWPLKFLVND